MMAISGLLQKLGQMAGFLPTEAPAPDPKSSRFVEAGGATVDADEHNWTRLSGDLARDLSPVRQERMRKMALFLWESNQLAQALIEVPVAYMLAEGVTLRVDDETRQDVLNRFWNDPINDMDRKLPSRLRELSIYGEQFYPAFVGLDGRVRLGYLDPGQVGTVVMDPDNSEQPIGVITRKDAKGNTRKYRVIVNGPESIFTKRTQEIRASFTDGECWYERVNHLASGSRGRSDLLAQIDFLDAYDQFLFGEMDRAKFMRAFFWDVKLTGATPDEVTQRAKKISAPAPGAVRVHNDSEEWKAETPDLKAADSSEHARLFRNHIMGGATFPEHWFGGGGDVNRAVGAEMGEPTFKRFSMRQRQFKMMIEGIGRYVLMRNESVVNNGKEIDWGAEGWRVEAVMPEMTTRDTTKYAAALQQCVVAAVMLIDKGLLTRATALAIVGSIAGRLGQEFDVKSELVAAEKELQRAKDQDDAGGELIDPPDDAVDAADIAEATAEANKTAMKEALDEHLHEARSEAMHTAERLMAARQSDATTTAQIVEGIQHASASTTLALREAAAAQQEATQASMAATLDTVTKLAQSVDAGLLRMAEALATAGHKTPVRERRVITLPDGRILKIDVEEEKQL